MSKPTSPIPAKLQAVESALPADFNPDSAMLCMEIDTETGKMEMRSPEDQRIEMELQAFLEQSDLLLRRVESRRIGYDTYKSLKKKASVVKNSIKNAFSQASSLLTRGERAGTMSKLEELKYLTDKLLARYDVMAKVFMTRMAQAFDVQESLREQSDLYKARLDSCLEYNRNKTTEVKRQWDAAFSLVKELDDALKGLESAKTFNEEVDYLEENRPRDMYIPWAMRVNESANGINDLTPEEQAKKAARKEADAQLIAEMGRRFIKVKTFQKDCTEFLRKLMSDRVKVEDVLGQLHDTHKYMNEQKVKITPSVEVAEGRMRLHSTAESAANARRVAAGAGTGNDDGAASEDAKVVLVKEEEDDRDSIQMARRPVLKYDHSECGDCTLVPSIARGCGGHLVAAFHTAEESARQLNLLLVRGEALRKAKSEIESNYTSWGDLPQSYSGGIYQESG